MTECTKQQPEAQLTFNFNLGKAVQGAFDAGQISIDGGLGLLRLVDERLRISEQVTLCIADGRDFSYVKHLLRDLVRQRIFMIAAGSEDVNDATLLRHDPMHKLSLGKLPSSGSSLASQPTLCRLENSISSSENSLLQELLLRSYIQRFRTPPEHIVLDVDTTCDPVHGYQQLSFFNGFYHKECYIPLFVFDQDGYPLLAKLRPGNFAPAESAAADIRHIVEGLRKSFPKTRIELRADAAFCNRDFYRLCEQNNVTFYIGLKSNHALRSKVKGLEARAKGIFESLYGPAVAPRGKAWRQREERLRFSSKAAGRMQEHFEQERAIRIVEDVQYQARSWDVERRVICRCDYTEEGAEFRFVVTNAKAGRPKWVYETKYCGRGQCENWIKELKVMKCDRLSCQEFEANQFRLLLHAFAYILLRELREQIPLRSRSIAIETVRLRFIKIAVLVKESVRRVRLHWTSTHPWQTEFCSLVACLQS
jgi:hypothetical protein